MVERGKVVMTPKSLVDKQLKKRLAEGLEDFRAGRSHGPFNSAKEAVRFLHAETKRRKTARKHGSRAGLDISLTTP